MYSNNDKYLNLEADKLIQGLPMSHYTELCHTPLTKVPVGIQVKIALVIRTENMILNINNSYVTPLDIKCYLEGRDPNQYYNNYPNILSRIADYLVTVHHIPKLRIIKETLIEPLGILKSTTDNTLYLPFELFVHDPFMLGEDSIWVNIKELQNDFKSQYILDTIIVENLKTT